MARWTYTLTTLFALAAWAGAQGPVPAPPPSTADQLRLLKANSTLIDHLVDSGVALSAESRALVRVQKCYGASSALATAIREAVGKQDADRVAELADLFVDVVRGALIKTLDDAKTMVPPESPDAEKVKALRGRSADDVRELKAAIPATGKVADNARVQLALTQFDVLAERLK